MLVSGVNWGEFYIGLFSRYGIIEVETNFNHGNAVLLTLLVVLAYMQCQQSLTVENI